MSSMKHQYGGKKGESVFYASRNAGRISGVEHAKGHLGNPTQGQDVIGEMECAASLLHRDKPESYCGE